MPGIEAMLAPGAAVALIPGHEDAGSSGGWLQSCGKTQLASYLAGALWRSRGVDLLAWVNAGSRASVLSGYAGAAAQLGLDHGGGAESVAARFAAWLAGTARPWLVVLDDLRDAADLDGLWPAGPAGRLLVTAAGSEVVPSGQAVTVPVPVFTQREAMGYLFDRLTTDPDQRSGAYDLVAGLGGEPAALAQASAVMAGSRNRLPRLPAVLRPAAGLRRPASRPPQRSPGYCRRTMPRNCCLAAAPGRCSCSPRSWTATGFPQPCSPPRPRASTSPARAPDPRLTLSRHGRQRWPWNTPGSSPSAQPPSRPRGLARPCRPRSAP